MNNSIIGYIVAVLIFMVVFTLFIQFLPYLIIAYLIYQLYRIIKRTFFKEPRNDGGVDLEKDVVYYDHEPVHNGPIKEATVIDVE